MLAASENVHYRERLLEKGGYHAIQQYARGIRFARRRRYTFPAAGSRRNLQNASIPSKEVSPACMRLLRQCGYRSDRLQIVGSIHIWKVWAGFRRMNGMLVNSNRPTAIYRSPSLGCPCVPPVFGDMLGPGRSWNKW